jgi:hypothetical protein
MNGAAVTPSWPPPAARPADRLSAHTPATLHPAASACLAGIRRQALRSHPASTIASHWPRPAPPRCMPSGHTPRAQSVTKTPPDRDSRKRRIADSVQPIRNSPRAIDEGQIVRFCMAALTVAAVAPAWLSGYSGSYLFSGFSQGLVGRTERQSPGCGRGQQGWRWGSHVAGKRCGGLSSGAPDAGAVAGVDVTPDLAVDDRRASTATTSSPEGASAALRRPVTSPGWPRRGRRW